MMKHFDRHPNIIQLYGVVFKGLNPVVIVELSTEGNLTNYLVSRMEDDDPVDWDTKVRYCYDVAGGLRALHAANIVHGDLKGDNVLLFPHADIEGELVAKVTDFGYSATKASIKHGGGTGGTWNFFAPECTEPATDEMKKYANEPTKDNYTFGLFVWQVARDGQTPYEGMEKEKIDKIKNSDKELITLLEEIPEDAPEYFKSMIVDMTKYAPKDRADLAIVDKIMGFDETNNTRYYYYYYF